MPIFEMYAYWGLCTQNSMIPMGKFLDRVADIRKAIREFHAGRVSNWIRVLSKWIRVKTGKGWNGASSQEVDWDGL